MKTLPLSADLFITEYKLKSEQPAYGTKTKTNNGKRNPRSQNYQFYTGDVTLIASSKRAVRELAAFLDSLQGSVTPFMLQLPGQETLNAITGTPALLANYTSKTKDVVIAGFSGELVVGDKFTLLNDEKVYTLLNSGTAGDSFSISPSLRKQHNMSRLAFNPPFTVRLKDNKYTLDVENISYLKIKLQFEEKL